MTCAKCINYIHTTAGGYLVNRSYWICGNCKSSFPQTITTDSTDMIQTIPFKIKYYEEK